MDPRYLSTLGSVVASDGKTNIINAQATAANIAIAQKADPSVTVPYAGYAAAGAISTTPTIGRMLRPFPQYSSPSGPTWDNIGNISYNAFELSLKMREYKGVNFTVNWTYSKNLGDDGTVRASYAVPAAASSNGLPIAGNNRADRAMVITDIPENLNIFGYGKLPFGRGKIGGENWAVRTFAGGWTFSGIFRYTSGTPILITGTGCTAPAQGTCMPDLAPGRRLASARTADGYGGPGVTYANFTQKSYLDTTAFAPLSTFPLPTGATGATAITKIGTAPRDSTELRGPSNYNIDAALQRSFNLTKERVKFVFRADCFDVTNKVSFTIPQAQTVQATNPSASATSFGRFTSFSGNRRFQFSGRITF